MRLRLLVSEVRAHVCEMEADSPDRDGVLTTDAAWVRFEGVGSAHNAALIPFQRCSFLFG